MITLCTVSHSDTGGVGDGHQGLPGRAGRVVVAQGIRVGVPASTLVTNTQLQR